MKKRVKPQKKSKTILVRTTSSIGISYRRNLRAIAKYIIQKTKSILYPVLKETQPDYVNDAWSDTIEGALKRLSELFSTVNFKAETIASNFINGVDKTTSEKIKEEAIKKLGVNAFLHNPELDNFLKLKIRENANLIKSIHSVYYEKLSSLVYGAVSSGKRASEIKEEIQKLSGITERRANFIAKDQIKKATALVSQKRYEAIGSTKYKWRNSQDERVRRKKGDPPGYWPYGKYSHWDREDVEYSWSKPPPDGHPGMAPGCRCYAEAIIPEI